MIETFANEGDVTFCPVPGAFRISIRGHSYDKPMTQKQMYILVGMLIRAALETEDNVVLFSNNDNILNQV
jgi:hypothetical protein